MIRIHKALADRRLLGAPRNAAATAPTAPSVAHNPSNELVSLLRMASHRVTRRLHGRARILFGCLLFGFITSCAQSTVTLTPFTSPSEGQPGIQRIDVTGSNFPADAVPPSAVTVSLAPSTPGSGPSGSATASAVTTVSGSTRRVTFTIPTAVTVTAPTSYQVSLSGRTSTGIAFFSGNTAALTINPLASLLSVTPASGAAGRALTVTLTAANTNFAQGATMASFGPGIAVGDGLVGDFGPVTITSATSATAQIVISPSTAAGARDVRVATGIQMAALAGGFTVLATPPPPVLASPLVEGSTTMSGSGAPGARVDIFVNGGHVATGAIGDSGKFAITVPALAAGQQVTAAQTITGVTSNPSTPVTVAALPPPPPIVGSPLVAGGTNLTGTATAGASVQIFIDGVEVGTALATGAGAWNLVVSPLVAGGTVKVRQTIAGVTSAFSSEVTVPPPPPIVNPFVVAGDMRVSGMAIPGALVRVFISGAIAGATAASPDGTWALPLATALVAGQGATATQTVAGVESALSARVLVAPAVLRQITLMPAPTATVAKGQTVSFQARGTFSDGSTVEPLPGVTWTSDTPAVATIEASGVAQGVAPGVTNISASSAGVSSAPTQLTVAARVVMSLTVAPPSAAINMGQTAAFQATALLSDGTSQDVTTAVTWASSDVTVATIGLNTGLAEGIGRGRATVTATHPAGPTAAAALRVIGAPVITGLSVMIGQVGDALTITGIDFVAIQSVTFNGIPADIQSNTETTIATSVPPRATTGPLTVTTAAGAAGVAFTVTPPDPSTVAPPLDPTVATDLNEATSFLYSGPTPIQTGVAPGTIVPARTAILRGIVTTGDGKPLPAVQITVLNHPEFGQTISRLDGAFDLAVNGGGTLTVNYVKPGFPPAQRQISVPWQDYALLPTVALVSLDAQVTTVTLSATSPLQVAQGTVMMDGDGSRRATLLFPPGTSATMTMANGSAMPVTTLSVRATEYTVGPNGPSAMPNELPPTSGYTYAVELSADEALTRGAVQTSFSQPLPFYIENFVNFPTGQVVPVGSYDRVKAQWIPEANGVVVKILSVNNGVASLDVDGGGNPASASDLAALGITNAELTQLGSIYAAGQSLWRVPISHFSPFDLNWPYGPDCGTQPCPGSNQLPPCQGSKCPSIDRQCQQTGSLIGCERQTLGEALGVRGTGFTLHYQSDRQVGNAAARTLIIPLSGATVPNKLLRIDLKVFVAGQTILQSFPAIPNQTATVAWNGRDAYGRPLQGSQAATVMIGYVYKAVYLPPAKQAKAFGQYGGALGQSPGRDEVTVWRTYRNVVGEWDDRSRGLGGWSLDVHHAYDPGAKVLYLGNGQQRSAEALDFDVIATVGCGGPVCEPFAVTAGPDGSLYIADSPNQRIRRVGPDGIITTVAGGGTGGLGDGGRATEATLFNPTDVAAGSDGSLYIADSSNQRVRRVDPSGIITTVAGTGVNGFSGDGGPAIHAQISSPSGIGLGPDGSLYIADSGNNRVRRIGTDGIITTVAGNGLQLFGGDGGLATQAQLNNPERLALGPDGSLYIADRGNSRVRQISLAGIITTFAGNGVAGFSGDGFAATEAQLNTPRGIAVGPDGGLYIADSFNHRVRRVDPSGIITTVAGGGTGGLGDGGPATRAQLDFPLGVAVAPDGSLLIGDSSSVHLRRVRPSFPGPSAGQSTIPSRNGTELYIFDGGGRHLKTLNALTGALHYQFAYDPAGRLASITDADGNVTTIQHDANGNPTAIVAPFGQQTTLAVDGNGYLSKVTSPVGNAVQLNVSAQGLLNSLTDARGNVHAFTYDALGRLTKDLGPDGSAKTLVRTDTQNGYQIGVTMPLGRTTTYAVVRLATGAVQQTVTFPNGTQAVSVTGTDGSRTLTAADGTVTTIVLGPDPRFGMLAPVASSYSVRTPGGLTSTTSVSRAASLTDPTNPFSLTHQTDTVIVNGKTYTRLYDATTRTFTTTSPTGRKATASTDTQGRVVLAQQGNLAPVAFTYDAHGRPAMLIGGNGPSARTTSFTYDPAGNLATITDPLQRATSFAYDADGRLIREILPDGEVVTFGYDPNSNLTSINPPGRSAHAFAYNSRDRLASYSPPDVGLGNTATRYSYSPDRQLTEITRPDDLKRDFSYDGAGRLSTLSIPTGQLRFAYDPNTGHATSIAAPSGLVLGYAYDGLLTTGETWSGPVTGSVTVAYDTGFRVISQSLNGTALALKRDQDSLLTQAGSLALQRDASTGLVTGTSLGTVGDRVTYDPFGYPTSYSASAGSTPLYSVQFTRDNLGRITEKSETIGGATDTYAYSYDQRGRLVQVQKNGAIITTYTYDANGNRLSATGPTGTADGIYDAQDRLISYGTATYAYTANGELQSATTGGQTTTYQHDVLGNIVGAALPSGTQVSYLVDGQNRRVGKKQNGTLLQSFLYQDTLRLVAELDGNNTVVSRFVYGSRLSLPDYLVKGGNTYRIITDQVGSPRLVVDVATGAIAQRLDYDEFGNVLRDTNPGFQPFGFAGGLYDRDTKLIRFGARDYDPATGRLTTKDPIRFSGGGANLYGYVLGDPVNHVDFSGLCFEDSLQASLCRNAALRTALAAEGIVAAEKVAENEPAVAEGIVNGAEKLVDVAEDCLALANTIQRASPFANTVQAISAETNLESVVPQAPALPVDFEALQAQFGPQYQALMSKAVAPEDIPLLNEELEIEIEKWATQEFAPQSPYAELFKMLGWRIPTRVR
jgi:RHS repeat-associated protein